MKGEFLRRKDSIIAPFTLIQFDEGEGYEANGLPVGRISSDPFIETSDGLCSCQGECMLEESVAHPSVKFSSDLMGVRREWSQTGARESRFSMEYQSVFLSRTEEI